MANLIRAHQPCDDCGSSDAKSYYDDGSSYCFSCQRFKKATGDVQVISEEEFEKKLLESIEKGKFRDIPDRGILKSTCEKYGVRTIQKNGVIIEHKYPYQDAKGNRIATKTRICATKEFYVEGSLKNCALFGQCLFPSSGKYVTCCEGCIDSMSVYQMFGGLYPVVGVPSGATSSKQAILNNYEWLCGFDNIIICFDADKAGQKGAKEIAQILPPEKVKIVKLDPSLKDPNEYLKAGKTQEFISRWWKAEEYRPDDLVNIGDMFDRVKDYRKEHSYISTPWTGVNDKISGTRAGQLVVLASGCVDGDTEFFTGTKWKKISEYTKGDKVLQFDKDTFIASLTEPEDYIKKDCEWFYHFKTKYGLDMVLSPEHNVLYAPEGSLNLYKVSAEEVANKCPNFRGKIPTSFVYGREGIPLTDTEIKLMLAVIADSSIRSSKSVMFHIKKQRKKEELKKLLEEYGEPYNWYDRKDGYSDIRVHPPRIEKEFTEFWYGCSKEQLKLICDNVLKWDGFVKGKKKQFSTTIKASADFIQFAFSSCGYRARLFEQDRRGQFRGKYERKSIEYTVQISERNFVGMRSSGIPEKIASKDGFKYCFTVPTHCLVLRRNGCVFCTGNTGMGKSAFLRTWMDYLVKTTEEHIGALYMEEKPEETVISLMSLHAGRNLKKPEVWDLLTDEELKKFFEECGANRRIELFDPILSASPEYILDKIRYMYQARKCTVIFLDHLTYLVDDSDDVRRDLNKLCKGLHDLCVSLGITVIAACHLRKAQDARHSHEEGGRVTLDDLKDSSSIKQLSDVIIGLERDSQSENPLLANTTTIRVLKNRDFGDKGIACGAVYDKDTTRLQEISGEELAAMKGGDDL